MYPFLEGYWVMCSSKTRNYTTVMWKHRRWNKGSNIEEYWKKIPGVILTLEGNQSRQGQESRGFWKTGFIGNPPPKKKTDEYQHLKSNVNRYSTGYRFGTSLTFIYITIGYFEYKQINKKTFINPRMIWRFEDALKKKKKGKNQNALPDPAVKNIYLLTMV